MSKYEGSLAPGEDRNAQHLGLADAPVLDLSTLLSLAATHPMTFSGIDTNSDTCSSATPFVVELDDSDIREIESHALPRFKSQHFLTFLAFSTSSGLTLSQNSGSTEKKQTATTSTYLTSKPNSSMLPPTSIEDAVCP